MISSFALGARVLNKNEYEKAAINAANFIINKMITKDGYHSISLLNLIKLARITADTDLEEKAMLIIKAFSRTIEKSPESYTQFITSFDFFISPSYEVVIVGDSDAIETKRIFRTINSRFIPNKIVILKSSENMKTKITGIADYLKDFKMINNKPTIYVCSNHT